MPDLSRRAALTGAALLPIVPPAIPPLAAPALAQTPPARTEREITRRPLFGAVEWTLPNGLRVVLAENRRAPVAAHYLYVSAGAGEDPAGRSGVAHFLEHMAFKGSPAVPSGAFSRTVANEGGQDNAFTSRDVTGYFQIVEASRLPLMMRMEADRLGGVLMPAEEVEPERGVILEERRSRVVANPRARFMEAFDAAMWGAQHWRGRPLIGWEEEIRAISRQDMLDFNGRFYGPGNCVLVVAGDVREAELRRWSEEFYGPIPARAPATPPGPPPGRRDRAAPPARAPEARLVVRDPAVREPSFIHSFAAPSATWGETRLADPLEIAAHVLGGGTGSRLHAALVETGLAVGAGASYDGDTVGVGTLSLFATPRPGVTPAQVEHALRDTVERLVQEGITEAETRRAIRQQTAGALLALDGLGAAPRMLGGSLAIGLSLEDVEFWAEKLSRVTAEQATEGARAVLKDNPVNTAGWLLPAGA